MTLTLQSKARILLRIYRKGLSLREYAKVLGVDHCSLQRFLKGGNTSGKFLDRVADYVGRKGLL